MPASATASERDTSAPPQGRRKWLLMLIIGLLVLAIAFVTVLLVQQSQARAWEEDGQHEAVRHAPVYLALDTMVVNLADPGGNRYAQLGITLKLRDEDVAEAIRTRMPSIRNAVLLQVSQRTAGELLSLEGKQRLNLDIVREISTEMGYPQPPATANGASSRTTSHPVQAVLFSSFLVQ
jgi:flagellar FliL protein